MSNKDRVKIIVTLGPATRTEEDVRKFKDRGADFVRINMSHSTLEDLRHFISLAKKVGIPFIIDTEGSQIRTGEIAEGGFGLLETEEIKIYNKPIIGAGKAIHLRPEGVVELLERGDLIYIDFQALILRVADVSKKSQGWVAARAVTEGILKQNKAVVIDFGIEKELNLPALSEKDYESIRLGLASGVEYIAASFMRSGKFVDEVRKATGGKMKIFSKIESKDALDDLDAIAEKSDYLYLDRGDLSKEISIESVPMAQKKIFRRARELGKDIFVATNFLESMVTEPLPTRAEANDVVNTVLDGAVGLVLSSETAIGKYPFKAINMLNKLINETDVANRNLATGLVPPHGGKLIDRVFKNFSNEAGLAALPKIQVSENAQMDIEQIAIGTFSPLEGFMNRADLQSVLDNTRLGSGVVWPLPVILDVSEADADRIAVGQDAALADREGRIMAILHVDDKYNFDKLELVKKLYGTDSHDHPGVKAVYALHPVFLGGKIDLLKRRVSESKEYELTPRQVRRLFEERAWRTVVGFHTRNVIHRGHEFIQLEAMRRASADGLFVHPIVGKKKAGDYHAKYIIKSYEKMIGDFYPRDSVVFATFATYSRYAGPREALFTAICRQNFGCSHFIVGRDHTGVKDFYHPQASHDIFDKFPELLIKPIRFDRVFYSQKHNRHVHEPELPGHPADDQLNISGTEARKMFERGEAPPEWFMRPEIAKIILDAIKDGDDVFVE